MDPRSASPAEPPGEVVAEPDAEPDAEVIAEPVTPPRQRWRLVLARDAGTSEAPALTGRDLADAWDEALDASGLPLVRPAGRARARLAFGAPVPGSMALERELADILLTEMVPVWVVREGLVGHLPDGWRLIDVHDIWLGAPALAGQVAAADYRIDLGEVDAEDVASAANALLAAGQLPRERLKGNATVTYDLRPLVVDVAVEGAGQTVVIRARTRFHAALGTGRPEEVVAALGDLAGQVFEVGSIVRERLLIAEEIEADASD